MHRRIDQEALLQDVLAGESAPDSTGPALDQLLELARRKRRTRRLQQTASAMAVIVAVVSIAFVQANVRGPREPSEPVYRATSSYASVTSQALAPDQVISSQPLAMTQWIETTTSVAVVHSAANDLQPVNDAELLELARPNIAVLVRRSPQDAELVFVAAPLASTN